MITDTDGIVLRQTLFGDNDIIVKILTKKLGVISFMVKSGRKSKKKKYLQPLMLVSISFKHNKNKSIQYLNEIRLNEISSEILNNYEKRTVSLFLCEIISKCLQEGMAEKETYNFIDSQIKWLNQKSNSAKYFDVWFLANFTKVLGISPFQEGLSKGSINYFNIETASFINNKREESWNQETSLFLYDLLNEGADNLKNFSLSKNLSRFVLNELVKYYTYHLNDLKLDHCLSVYNVLKL